MNNSRSWLISMVAALTAGGASGNAIAQGAGAQAGLLEEITVTARRREENLQDLPLSIAALSADDMQTQGIYYANDVSDFIPSVTLNEDNRSQTMVFIRGVGGGHPDASFSWGSGIYEDGHYVQFGRTGFMSTVDIDRIEVLRGPQGTLFGRNTIGGAVNIISTKPQPEFDAELTARLGDFGQQDLRAMINFPISENVFARLSAATEESDGYYYNRTLGHDQGATDRTSVRAALRFTPGNWTIDAVLSSTSQSDEDNGGQCAPGIRGVDWDGRAGPFPFAFSYGETSGGFSFGPPFFGLSGSTAQDDGDAACNAALAEGEFVAGGEIETFANVDIDSTFLTARWDADGAVGGLENVSVTTSVSYRDMKNVNLLDSDYNPLPVFYVAANSGQTSESTSLEVLFEADASDRLRFLLGANYFESDTDNARGPDCYDYWLAEFDGVNTIECPYTNGVTLGLLPLTGFYSPIPFGPGPAFIAASRYDESRAVFGHMTYALTDLWDLELGVRYTEDEQHSINAEWVPSNFTIPVSTGCCVYDRFQDLSTLNFTTDHQASFDGTTPKISLTRRFEGAGNLDSGMVYFLVSEGYLTGGFNTEIPPGPAEALRNYGPEEVTNYEVGFKGTFGGGRLRLNSAIFYMDYRDKQVEIEVDNSLGQFGGSNPTLGVFQNAASVAITGFEVELTAVPWDRGLLSANLGNLNTDYDEFTSLTEDGTLVDLSNTDIPNESPEWTLNASLAHTFTFGNGGTLTPMLGVYYQSEYDWLGLQFVSDSPNGLSSFQGDIPGNLCFDDGYTKFRARLTYNSPGGKYSTSLFGRNITDESILDRCEMQFGFFLSRLEQPATWGVEFTARWGDN